MALKTPEQIAAGVIAANYEDEEDQGRDVLDDLLSIRNLSGNDVRSLLTAAIEADRAQRAAEFAGDLSQIIEFMAEDKSNDWSEEIAKLTELEAAL